MKVQTQCILLCAAVAMLLAQAQTIMAVNCRPIELSACVSAITTSNPPTTLCCSKIKEQKPCLCGYLQNPNLKRFVNSPNARKVATTCGTPFPKC